MLDVIMFIPNTLPILLHKKLGRGTQFKLSIPTLTGSAAPPPALVGGKRPVSISVTATHEQLKGLGPSPSVTESRSGSGAGLRLRVRDLSSAWCFWVVRS